MGKRYMLPGALAHQPLQQGDLDDLCGLYATINAICVVMAPHRALSDREIRKLTRAGVQYLDKEKGFRKAFDKGMTVKLHRKLANHMVQQAHSLTGAPLSMRRLSLVQAGADQGQLIHSIEEALQQGAAVMMGLHNTHDHFTVVVGCSTTRLYLADSDGLHWLPKRHVGPYGGTRPYRHGVCLKEMFTIGIPR